MKRSLLGTAVLISCLSFSSLAHAQPTLTSFSPVSGSAGTEVIVFGTNLVTATAVTFNGVSAVIQSISGAGSSVTAIVPLGATTGLIAVTTSGGTATTSTAFVVSDVPTLTSFSPVSGSAGTEVIVFGTNLVTATAVTFNGVSAVIQSISGAGSSVTAIVPLGATTGLIAVTTSGGTATTPTDFVVVPSRPIADAGPSQLVECASLTNTPVTLDGSGSSDPDGDSLTYAWTGPFPEGGGTVTGVNPTVTLPLGTSTITLVVNDGQEDSAPSEVDITVFLEVDGLLKPFFDLSPDGEPVLLPKKAFKQGKTLQLKLKRVGIRHGDNNLQGFEVVKRCLHWLR